MAWVRHTFELRSDVDDEYQTLVHYDELPEHFADLHPDYALDYADQQHQDLRKFVVHTDWEILDD